MYLLKLKCYEDSLFGDMYDENTYSKPIYRDLRWEGTLIANEFGGLEGHVKNDSTEFFVFGYYVPDKGIILYEFSKNASAFNVMTLDTDLDFSVNKNAEILNPNSPLQTISSYYNGGYEVANRIYNDYCGSTESYCRILIDIIKQIDEKEAKNNEEIRSIYNKILEQREKMSNKQKYIYSNFASKLQEFIQINPNKR